MRPRSERSIPLTLLLSISLAAAIAAGCKEPPPAAAPPPPEVYVVDVVQKDVPVYLELVGQTEGFQDIDVRARVEGFLQSVNFTEGTFVHKGDLLYQIDRAPFEATLAAMKGDLGKAEAQLEKTNNDVKRYTPLVTKQAVSQQELDDALAAQAAARSQVDAAKAAVDKAAIDLGYTRVTAPIDGLIGTTQVKPGSLVGRGESTLLTTVSQINPILFNVGMTESDYLRLVKRHPARSTTPDISGIELTLADSTVHVSTGRVHAVERAVNATTGTLGVQLIFPNDQLTLRPGQYGRARVLVETRKKAILVPQRAVQELQNLRTVGVVDPSGKVTFTNVKVGPRVDSDWVIESGLSPGTRVVAEGLQSVADGMMVRATSMPAAAPASGSTEAVPTSGGKQ
jgi:membrane fusion protein (multidrug efflux system)